MVIIIQSIAHNFYLGLTVIHRADIMLALECLPSYGSYHGQFVVEILHVN